ncbi:MAG: ABC transporter permease [Proteobacteria bacterium]|nr:ABC transporter permease [Pseudomonadota bacterium]
MARYFVRLANVLAGTAAILFLLHTDILSNIVLGVVLVLFVLWLFLFERGRQAGSVTHVGISTLRQRVGSSSVIVLGIAGVVAVLVAMLAMAGGYRETLRASGSDDTVLVLRGASSAEVMSTLDNAAIQVIQQTAGIAKDSDGRPLASAETVVAANLPTRNGGPDDTGSVQVRGVGPQAWLVRPNLKITQGRKFEPGRRELVVGSGAQRQFRGLDVGKQVRIGSDMWNVVGVFHAGDANDSEIWADAEIIAATYRRGSTRNSVIAKLESPQAFKAFKATLAADPRMEVETQTTLDYFSKQSETMTKAIRIIGMIVGAIMAIGAVFGALNTMFATVATRAREIATLRAIGFRSVPVVIAVMLETMLLALLGGLVGGALAWLVFNGYTASTIAGGIGQLTFAFKVSPDVLWTGIKWALAIGFIGGLFPALRAARMPVTDALRSL